MKPEFPKLIVQADPEHAGKHPCHEFRFITTDHAFEIVSRDIDGNPIWGFENEREPGNEAKIIAAMRDLEHQEAYAALFAAAPQLLEHLKRALAEGHFTGWGEAWNLVAKVEYHMRGMRK